MEFYNFIFNLVSIEIFEFNFKSSNINGIFIIKFWYSSKINNINDIFILKNSMKFCFNIFNDIQFSMIKWNYYSIFEWDYELYYKYHFNRYIFMKLQFFFNWIQKDFFSYCLLFRFSWNSNWICLKCCFAYCS